MSDTDRTECLAECTEDGENQPKFWFSLYSGFNDGPVIVFNLPEEIWPDDYTGMGIFSLPLEGLLEAGLQYHLQFDHGKNTHLITKLLREYADKLDESAAKFRKENNLL